MIPLNRHTLKALGLFFVSLLLILVLKSGAERGIVPSLESLLTRPLATLLETPRDNETVEEEILTPAPVISEPSPPVRIAAGEPESVQHVEETVQTDRDETVEIPPLDSLFKEDGTLLSSLSQEEEENAPEPITEDLQADWRKEDFEARERIQRREAEKNLDRLLRQGGELVLQGARLPVLNIAWSPHDIEELVAEEYGYIIGEWNGNLYRGISRSSSFLDTREFVLLTEEVSRKMSNRGIELNGPRRENSYRDPSFEEALLRLQRRLLNQTGGNGKGETPVFTFFPSKELETYLSYKQLGAVASLGVDLKQSKWSRKFIATFGTLQLTETRPVYLIHHVSVGSESHPWEDPESVLFSK